MANYRWTWEKRAFILPIPGPCASAFPIFSTSRILAGGGQKNDIFKCALKPVETALGDGTYGTVIFSDEQKLRLQTIFVNGVCDYNRGDVGKPKVHRMR
jgi:hypothetical protein